MNDLSKNLSDISARINVEHEKCVAAGRACLQHAMEAGRLLVEAKSGVGHGNWLSWLEANFKGSGRAAQMYMRFHANRDRLEAAGGVDKMGIGQAMRVLQEPHDLKDYLEGVGVDVVDGLLPPEGCELVGSNDDLSILVRIERHPQPNYVHVTIFRDEQEATWFARGMHWAAVGLLLKGERIDGSALDWAERPAESEPSHQHPMEAAAA